MTPERSLNLAMEMARPVIEHLVLNHGSRVVTITPATIYSQVWELFEVDEANAQHIAYHLFQEIVGFLATFGADNILQCPVAAATVLAGNFQWHILVMKLKERTLEDTGNWQQRPL